MDFTQRAQNDRPKRWDFFSDTEKNITTGVFCCVSFSLTEFYRVTRSQWVHFLKMKCQFLESNFQQIQ